MLVNGGAHGEESLKNIISDWLQAQNFQTKSLRITIKILYFIAPFEVRALK